MNGHPVSCHLTGELIQQILPPRPGRGHVADDDAVEDEHEEDEGQHHEEEYVLGLILPANEAPRVPAVVVAIHGHCLGDSKN